VVAEHVLLLLQDNFSLITSKKVLYIMQVRPDVGSTVSISQQSHCSTTYSPLHTAQGGPGTSNAEQRAM
jgi:hypothetical protein